jgi:hypothetical protein
MIGIAIAAQFVRARMEEQFAERPARRPRRSTASGSAPVVLRFTERAARPKAQPEAIGYESRASRAA